MSYVTTKVIEPVAVKVATQLTLTDMVTAPSRQSASPDQTAGLMPAFGVAVKVTDVPTPKAARQPADGQLIPLGLDVTTPGPLTVTLKFLVTGGMMVYVIRKLLVSPFPRD